MHASYGSVAAEDCVLKTTQAISKVIVNSSSCFELSTANARTTGRVFDGTEDVIAFVTGQWYVNMCVQQQLADLMATTPCNVAVFGRHA